MKVYTAEQIEEALRIASVSSKSISDAFYAAGDESTAEVSIATSLSFEQVFRASLRLDNKDEVVERP